MKNLKVLFALMALAMFTLVSSNDAQAQSNQDTNVGQLAAGLITVQVGAVALNVGDITLEDLVDVNNVLNQNDIRILNNILNNSPIASNNQDFLNNLLREAKLITGNTVVVGVLSSTGQIVTQTLP